MTKRLIFAVVLSVIVLFISDVFIRRAYKSRTMQKAGQEQVQKSTETVTRPVLAPRTGSGVEKKKGKEIRVDSQHCEAIFSWQGEILHWYLKDYKEKDGTPVDLVSSSGPISDYNYEALLLKNEKGVVLRTVEDGVEITKEIVFEETKNYQALVRFRIINNSSSEKNVSVVKWGPGIGRAADQREVTISSWSKKGLARLKSTKVKGDIKQDRDVEWIGLGEKYFAVALIPQESSQQQLFVLKESEGISIQSMLEKVPPGARIEGKLVMYAGPKDGEVLKSAGSNLSALIHYGSIGKVIFSLLKWFYFITRNYGVAIILLSALIKVILFPLSRVSLKSMRGMQKIQPQIAMLKQRFKHDPGALNKETMELYKRMKINPMGGCLPMIFQLPIFWALFVVLRDAIELRQAPFIFWIKDLSSKDPFYILPVLMGVTTLIQQKMTATDKQQSMMTYFMTIFMTVIFLNFPSGLVLYWFITNVLSIGEQKIVSKMSR